MLVNNKTKRVVTVLGTRLVPGFNEVASDSWDKIKKELGGRVGDAGSDFSVVTDTEKDAAGKPVNKGPVAFDKLSADKAAKVVEDTNDPELLSTWLKTESRDSVRKAIYTRLEALGVKGGN